MTVEPWQIPVLVMAVFAGPVVVPLLIGVIRDTTPPIEGLPSEKRSQPRPSWSERLTPQARLSIKTLFWSVMIVVSLVVAVLSFGEQAIQIVSTAISSVSTLVSTILAIQNGTTLRQILSIAETEGKAPFAGSDPSKNSASAGSNAKDGELGRHQPMRPAADEKEDPV